MRKVQEAMFNGYHRALQTAEENKKIALQIRDAVGDPKALADADTASIVENRPLHQWRKRCKIPDPEHVPQPVDE